jgi:DNA-binding transcriptional MocR family regulator
MEGKMGDNSLYDQTKRETINPMVDEINKLTEPLLKIAMKEFGFDVPLTFRLYNQIRFYELSGKLKMGTSVASKESLAKQFGVTKEQIEDAFNNLTNRYKLGKWISHEEPVFRNVKRTWMSNARLQNGITAYEKYYSVIPKVLQRNTKSITAYQLAPEVRPLSESKKKVSEIYNNNIKITNKNTTKSLKVKNKIRQALITKNWEEFNKDI